jgi:hypothetical protein
MNPGSSRNEEAPETACEVTHLPSELLECILLKLSYAEIAQVRQVCRRFRVVADEVLDRKFRCLKGRAESHLAALIQEENSRCVSNSTGGDSAFITLHQQRDAFKVQFSSELLDRVCREIRLLRAVCYRPLYLSEVPQSLLDSSAYLKPNAFLNPITLRLNDKGGFGIDS